MLRRDFSIGLATLPLVGCRWGAEPVPTVPTATAPSQSLITAVLEGRPVDGVTPTDLAIAGALVAVRHCYSASTDGSGSASHAFLGVLSALRLHEAAPSVGLLPVQQAVDYVVRETSRPVYGPVPYQLGPVSELIGTPEGFFDAIGTGDIEAADDISARLAETDEPAARAMLWDGATQFLGHVGHAAMFVEGAAGLVARGAPVEVYRAPTRYIASCFVEDETIFRADSLSDTPAPASLVSGVCDLLLRGTVSFSTIHVLDSVVSVIRAERPELMRRAGAWLHAFQAGTTELGSLVADRDAPEPMVGTLQNWWDAARTQDGDRASRLIQGQWNASKGAWTEAFVRVASATGNATVQHSVKSLDAALYASALLPVDERWKPLAIWSRYAVPAYRPG